MSATYSEYTGTDAFGRPGPQQYQPVYPGNQAPKRRRKDRKSPNVAQILGLVCCAIVAVVVIVLVKSTTTGGATTGTGSTGSGTKGAPTNQASFGPDAVLVSQKKTASGASEWQQVGQTVVFTVAPSTGDSAGWNVDMNSGGNVIVIGELSGRTLPPNVTFEGQFRVFKLYGNKIWYQVGQTVFGESAFDFQGWTVRISESGNRVLAGAPFGLNGFRVYDLKAGVWTQTGNDVSLGGAAGTSLKMSASGNRVVASQVFGAFTYVYELDGASGQWLPMGDPIEVSGTEVAINAGGNRIVVHNGFSGQLSTYELNGAGQFVATVPTFSHGSTTSDVIIGKRLEMNKAGNRFVVCTGHAFEPVLFQGTMLVYELSAAGTLWTQVGPTLEAGAGAQNYGYGSSCAMSASGNTVAVGSPQKFTAVPGNGGFIQVYDYDRGAGSYVQRGNTIQSPVGIENDAFGMSVALSSSGNRVLGGAHQEEQAAENPGQNLPGFGAVFQF